MNNTSTYARVIETAADHAGVKTEDMRRLRVGLDGAEYEVDFHTDYMEYILYIDFGGAVLGFLSQPLDEHFTEAFDLFKDSLCV